ncbi:MAG: FHA domain-containing protein [Acidobacteriota bacterium]
MKEVTLIIHSPQGASRVSLTEGRLTIGRSSDVDLSIDDDGLSRLHATIYREGDRVWIVDENSTNGCRVNNAPATNEGTPLFDGDKIRLGNYTTIRVSASGAVARVADRQKTGMPTAAIAVLMAALLTGAVALISLLSNGRADDAQSRRAMPEDQSPRLESKNDNEASRASDHANTSPEDIESQQAIASPRSRKLYLQMSEEERTDFLYSRARHISRMMGNREYQFTEDVLPYIRQYVEGYARRVSNGSDRIWGEDLNRLFGRARALAPHIIRSFNSQGVPAVVGLYIPMIESEYRECLTSPVGAKGLFQFMPDTARGYGVSPDDRCNVEKMAPAAARYIKDRIAEFGTDSMSVALGIAGYNRSPDSVRRDLQDVLNSDNKERSFWTLVANSNKLDRYFQNENVKYVPKFFAAAIVGETPEAFGLRISPLSTYTQTNDRP